MAAKKSLIKLAVAISAVTMGANEARYEKEKHPLMQAAPEVDTVVLPDGGISKRLHLLTSSREKSHAEIVQMRQQRATHDRIYAKKQNSWTNSIKRWLGLSGACHDFSGAFGVDLGQAMLNFQDETFAIRITVAEAPNEMYAILDTGMAHTVIETAACSNCAAKKVTATGSPAGLTLSTTKVSGKLNNPATTYSGFQGTTTFCIYDDTTIYNLAPTSANIASMPCIQEANVHFADKVATANPAATAYLGLALGNGVDFYGNKPKATDLVFKQLVCKEGGSQMLGISLTRDLDALGSTASTTTSFIDLGTTTTTNLRDGTTPGTIKFNDDEYYWKAPLNGIWFGTNENRKFALNNQEVTIETGTQCTYVPEEFYETVLERVLDYSTGYYFTEEGDVVVDCGDVNNMKTLRLLVNDQWVEISQFDYLNPIRTTLGAKQKSTGQCRVCIKQSSDSFWHLGTSAFIGYYTAFDFAKKTISLTPLSVANKRELMQSSKPDLVMGLNWVTMVLLVLGMALIITVFVLLCIAVCYQIGPFHTGGQGKKSTTAPGPSKMTSLAELEVMLTNALLKKQNQF